MASNYNCHLPGPVPAHLVPGCSLPSLAAAAAAAVSVPPNLPVRDVIVKAEPHDDDGANGDGVSSHDAIRADLAPTHKEVPSGRTVLGIFDAQSTWICHH